jgi:hypothetical protein
MHRAKGPTARWANKLLGRAGKPFWQEEYFDRLVRSASECKQIRPYLELNPVKASLWRIPRNSLGPVPAGAKAGLKTRADLSPPSAEM